MKKTLFLAVTALLTLSSAQAQNTLRLMTYNIKNANGMDNVFAWQVIATRHLCAARHAAVQRYAFFKQLRPSRAVYAAINAPAAEQGHVSGVNNGVHVHFRNIVSYYPQRHCVPPVLFVAFMA